MLIYHTTQRLNKEAVQQRTHLDDIKLKVANTKGLLDAQSYVEELEGLASQVEEVSKEVQERLQETQDVHDKVVVLCLVLSRG